MKKTYNKFLSLLLFVTLFTSCKKFLDQEPKNTLYAESFFTSNASAELALNTAYGAMRANDFLIYGINAFPTDYTKLNQTGQNSDRQGIAFYQHLPTNSTIENIWNNNYNVIVRANAVIVGVKKSAAITKAKLYEAEAKTLRALAYFNLVRMFGDVPKVTFGAGEYQPAFEELERAPKDTIWNFIVSDLEFAIANADVKAKLPFGRITKGFATGLLAKVYLFLGSYQQRDNLGDGKAHFQKCLDLCRTIRDGGEYSLVPYFPDNFIIETERNNETLLSINFENNINLGGTVGEHMGILGNGNNAGSIFPGQVVATDFAWQNGTLYNYNDSIRRLWTIEKVKYTTTIPGFTFNASNPAVESFDDTIYVAKADHFPNRATGGIPINPTQAQVNTFFGNRFRITFPATMITKYRRFPRWSPTYIYGNYPMDLPVMRYSEILLMLSEAATEVAGAPTVEAYSAINTVRARARNRNNNPGGLKADVLPRIVQTIVTNAPDITGLTYTQFREEILQERSRELFGEWGLRWYDLQRRGELQSRVNFVYNNFICTYLGNNRPEFRFGRTETVTVLPHHILLPIPQTEIIKNPKLTQNPGYPN